MEKEEILESAQKKKDIVGEMERVKINKSNWIAIIITGIVAVAFMVVEGALLALLICVALDKTFGQLFYFDK